jgi:hypothetical protein
MEGPAFSGGHALEARRTASEATAGSRGWGGCEFADCEFAVAHIATSLKRIGAPGFDSETWDSTNPRRRSLPKLRPRRIQNAESLPDGRSVP